MIELNPIREKTGFIPKDKDIVTELINGLEDKNDQKQKLHFIFDHLQNKYKDLVHKSEEVVENLLKESAMTEEDFLDDIFNFEEVKKDIQEIERSEKINFENIKIPEIIEPTKDIKKVEIKVDPVIFKKSIEEIGLDDKKSLKNVQDIIDRQKKEDKSIVDRDASVDKYVPLKEKVKIGHHDVKKTNQEMLDILKSKMDRKVGFRAKEESIKFLSDDEDEFLSSFDESPKSEKKVLIKGVKVDEKDESLVNSISSKLMDRTEQSHHKKEGSNTKEELEPFIFGSKILNSAIERIRSQSPGLNSKADNFEKLKTISQVRNSSLDEKETSLERKRSVSPPKQIVRPALLSKFESENNTKNKERSKTPVRGRIAEKKEHRKILIL